MESPRDVKHGLVLHIDGQPKRLDHTGFPQVEFTGQYPIGQVRLGDSASPISAVKETYSPFIPLDYDSSSLPVTVMEVTLKNAGATAVEVELEAYLENAAVRYQASTNAAGLRRVARVIPITGGAMVTGEVNAAPAPAASTRPDILISDFENTTWENSGWVAEGEAFQTGPHAGTLQHVKGFQGKAFTHSHNVRLASKGEPDNLTGILTSPPFKVERRYLSFLLVGGNRQGELAVQILLDDKVVDSLTGTHSNQFAPRSIDLSPWQGKELRVRLIDQAKGAWGSIGIDHLVLSDTAAAAPPVKSLRDHGSMALAILGAGAVGQAARGKTGTHAEASLAESQEMAVRTPLTLPAQGEVKITVITAWHFPQVHPDMGKLPDPRRWVAEKFADAAAVAAHVIKELPYLSGQTRAFRDTWYGAEDGRDRGTLPHWLLERSLWTLSTLTTNVSYRLTNGRFWGWEGTGCCPGTCTHVWHYAQGAGRLFP